MCSPLPGRSPHYYEWLRSRGGGGGGGGDVPCGGMPSVRQVQSFLRQQQQQGEHARFSGAALKILSLHQELAHYRGVELPRLALGRFDPDANADLRLRYLNNEIGEAALKRQLQTREKRRQKEVSLRQIYEMLTATAADLLRAMLDGGPSVDATAAELHELFAYANQCIRALNSQYGSKVAPIPMR